MKNKKGFTLVELLAVIVILSIIVIISTRSILKTVRDSKEATKQIAIKEIGKLAEAYCESENCTKVTLKDLYEADYISTNTNNPETGEKFTDDELNNNSIIITIDPNSGKAIYPTKNNKNQKPKSDEEKSDSNASNDNSNSNEANNKSMPSSGDYSTSGKTITLDFSNIDGSVTLTFSTSAILNDSCYYKINNGNKVIYSKNDPKTVVMNGSEIEKVEFGRNKLTVTRDCNLKIEY